MKPGACCLDRDVLEVAALVDEGFDQMQASRLVFGGPHLVTDQQLLRAYAGRQARRLVRDGFARRFPWLRLPPSTDREVA